MRALATCLKHQADCEAELSRLHDNVRLTTDDLRQNHLTGVLDMGFLAAHRRYMIAMQRQGRFGVHAPLLGQEAAVVGSVMALDPQTDWLVPTYREIVGMAMHGCTLKRLVVCRWRCVSSRLRPSRWSLSCSSRCRWAASFRTRKASRSRTLESLQC